jgi:hypothetical protein
VVAKLSILPESAALNIVSGLSLLSAFISGLSELFQRRQLWKEYSQAILTLKRLFGQWELEVESARQLFAAQPEAVPDLLKKGYDESYDCL